MYSPNDTIQIALIGAGKMGGAMKERPVSTKGRLLVADVIAPEIRNQSAAAGREVTLRAARDARSQLPLGIRRGLPGTSGGGKRPEREGRYRDQVNSAGTAPTTGANRGR